MRNIHDKHGRIENPEDAEIVAYAQKDVMDLIVETQAEGRQGSASDSSPSLHEQLFGKVDRLGELRRAADFMGAQAVAALEGQAAANIEETGSGAEREVRELSYLQRCERASEIASNTLAELISPWKMGNIGVEHATMNAGMDGSTIAAVGIDRATAFMGMRSSSKREAVDNLESERNDEGKTPLDVFLDSFQARLLGSLRQKVEKQTLFRIESIADCERDLQEVEDAEVRKYFEQRLVELKDDATWPEQKIHLTTDYTGFQENVNARTELDDDNSNVAIGAIEDAVVAFGVDGSLARRLQGIMPDRMEMTVTMERAEVYIDGQQISTIDLRSTDTN